VSTIWEITDDALSGLGVEYAANSMVMASGQQLPDLYMVYSMVSNPPLQHADDVEKLSWYRMQVSVFSRAGLASLPDVDSAMLAAGFTRSSPRELPYDPDTRHFGIALDYIYLEDLVEEDSF